MLNRSNHTYDLKRPAMDQQMLTQGIRILPVLASQGLIDDDYTRRRALIVGLGECASFKQRNSHDFEVRAAYNSPICTAGLAVRRGTAIDIEGGRGAGSAEWQVVDRRSVFHTRYGPDAIDHLPIENRTPARLGILRCRHGDTHPEDARRGETGIDVFELPETFDEQAGTNQQHHGKRQFRN